MIFVLPQSDYSLYQSPPHNTLGGFGCFLGFETRPVFSVNVLTDSFDFPFTSRKLNQRRFQAVDTQSFLLLLILKSVYDTPPNTETQFSARKNKQGTAGQEQSKPDPNQQYSSSKPFKDRGQSQQQKPRSEYQGASGSRRSEYQESRHFVSPNMTKVNEARDALGLQGSNLNTITESQVNKAYKKKARIHHPDKVAKDKAKESEEIFKKLVTYRDQLYDFINFRNSRRR